MEFSIKEGLAYGVKSGQARAVADVLEGLHRECGVRTIDQLTRLTKPEFIVYADWLGYEKEAESCWTAVRNILRRHGYTLYVKGRSDDSS